MKLPASSTTPASFPRKGDTVGAPCHLCLSAHVSGLCILKEDTGSLREEGDSGISASLHMGDPSLPATWTLPLATLVLVSFVALWYQLHSQSSFLLFLFSWAKSQET